MSSLCLSSVPRLLSHPARRGVVAIGAILASMAFAGSAQAHPWIGVSDPVRAASSGTQDFSAATHTGSSRVTNVSFYVDGRRIFLDRATRWTVPGGVDTRRLSNGRHRLRARVLFRNGATRAAEKVITVRNAIPAPDKTAPAAPTGLKATAAAGSVSLDWNDSPERDFSYYAVRRSTSDGGPWERLPGNHTSSEYVDKSVDPGRRYYYLVTAMDTAVNVSPGSPIVDATTPDPSPEPPAPTPNPPVWSSDFEGDVLSSWLGAQWDPDLAMSDRIRTDTSTARTGTRSARFEVRPGDNLSGTARAQIYGAQKPAGDELRFREGDDYHVGFSMKLGSTYPMDKGKWQQLVSFMRDGSGQGPLKLGTSFEDDNFRLEGPDGDKVYWRGPVDKGEWIDLVFRVHFSTDPSKGFIEVWHKRPGDGQLIRQSMSNGQDRLYVNTMAAGSTFSYLKAGVYRDESFSTTSTVWYDSFKVGNRFEDVVPR